MFIQVIQGPCSRPDDLRAVASTWLSDLGPGATGYLGGTFGFTDDGLFIGVIRFASRADADANSQRPEQHAWAQRLMATFDEQPEFRDYDEVLLLLDGGSDDAGFVQVIQGVAKDRAALDLLAASGEQLRSMRPEIIGGTFAIAADGSFTETVAFTDEGSARTGEALEIPPEIATALASVMEGAVFHDLHSPWFESP